MLSYQHDYHAGNHADVLKHWIVWECLQYLKRKPGPFTFVDTHAGSGVYDLNESMAQKTGEFRTGIARIVDAPADGMKSFVDAVTPWYQQGKYPGSSALAASTLRPDDTLWAFELHPRAQRALQETLTDIRLRKTNVAAEDGHSGLLRLLPTADKRAFIHIDPSYEVKSEYGTVIQTLASAWKKMPGATMALWYPVLSRRQVRTLEQQVVDSGITKIQVFELCILPDAYGRGMTGSGLIIINPPWTLASQARRVLPALAKQLATHGSAQFRINELSPI